MKKTHRLTLLLFSILVQSSLFSVIDVVNEGQLVGAINTANGAPDTINFNTAVPIVLTGPLPAITNTYPITGIAGATLDGGGAHRGFIVLNGGNPTISNITIQNVLAQGGDGGNVQRDGGGTGGGGMGAGGALFVGNGSQATLSSVTLNTCVATGGDAFDPTIQPNQSCSGGGGGGLGGLGGDGINAGGGGGGGGILENDDGQASTGNPGGVGVGGGGTGGVRQPAAYAIAGNYGGGGGGGGDAVGPPANTALSAIGGFGGGGGGGADRNLSRIGSSGGFGGGGGGGARNGAGSNAGGGTIFGGGSGAAGIATDGGQGGGGAGFGGVIFVDPTSSLTITTAVNPFAGVNTATGGTGANPGLSLGNEIFLASGGTLDFNVTAGTVTLANPIEADTLLATGGLTKSGAGILNLAALANTYRGTTTVSAGTLRVALDSALGEASTTVTLSGGTLQADATFASARSVAITAASSINTTPLATTLTLSGLVSGAGSLTKLGLGTLVLSNGGNNYSGGTDISAGTLQVGADGNLGSGNLTLSGGTLEATSSFATAKTVNITGASALLVTAPTVLTLNGAISSTAGSLSKNGTGTVVFGAANSYTVPTTINDGTLQLSGAGTLGNPSNLTLAAATSIFEILAGAGTKTIGVLNGVALSQIILNDNILNIPSGNHAGVIGPGTGGINVTGPGTLTLSGANTYTGTTEVSGGTLSVSADNNLGAGPTILLSGGTLQSTGTFPTGKNISITSAASNIDVTGANNLTVNGLISGSVGLSKTGTGILTLTNTNNYTGTTTLNGGTIALSGAPSTLGNVSPLNILSGTFDISAGGGNKTIGALTGVVGTSINLGANTLNIPSGSYDGVIGPGAGGINVTGPGTLTLSGVNIYTGITEVSGGILSVGADNNLGAGASITLSGGTLEVTGTFPTGKNISLNSAASNICVTAGNTFTVNGALSGAGGLTKNCPGTLALSSAANNYTPFTTINAGVLQLTGAGVLGATTPLTIVGGSFEILAGPKTIGTLTGAGNGIDLNANNLQIPDGNFSGQIRGAGGSIDKITAGTLTLSSPISNYTGGTTLTLGTLNISGPANLGTGPLIMNAGTLNPTASFTSTRPVTINGGTINTAGGVDYNLGGVVSGAGALLKAGTGTLTVSGAANLYNGTTTVSAGELFLNGGAFGPVSINPGARLAGNGSVGTINNSGTIAPGASAIGTINVSGNLNLSPSSVIDVEIDNLGNSDLLLLVANTANLGGTLNAIPVGPPIEVFPKDLEYTIISAALVNNNFATLTGTPPFQYFIRVDGGDVILFLQENVVIINLDAIEKGNPRSVAKYLASCKNPEMGLLDVLMVLEQLEGEVLNDALNQLSSARFGALSLLNYNSDASVARIFGDHLKKLYRCKTKIGACKDDEETFCFKQNNWSVWAEPFLNFSHHDKTEQQRSFHNETYGGVLGADYSFANNICLGGGAGYSYANMDWGQSLGKSLINSVYGGIYSSWFNQMGFVNLSVMGTRNFYHVGRRVHFPGYDRTAHHHHRGWDLTTHLGGGLEFPLGETFHFQPTLDIDYINVFQGEFRERNLGSIDLVVRRKQSGLLRSALALNLVNDFKAAHICYSPGILVGWVHEAYLSSANYKANMTCTCLMDSSFIVKTFHKDQDYRLLGVSMTVIHDKGFVFTVNYHAEFNHLYTKHEGRGRFEWNF